MKQLLTLKVDDIVIPDNRTRDINEKKIEDIALSIARYGLFQPIIVYQDDIQGKYILWDGLHRLTCHQMNGMPEIQAVLREHTGELLGREVELEVNIQRVDMTWQERTRAIAEIQRLKSEKDPSWTQQQTAEIVGGGQNRVAEAVKLDKMMELFPELAKAKSVSQAQNWAKQKAESIARVQEVANAPEDFSAIEERIILGDSVEVIKTLPDESFDIILTDPPFGIDYDSRTDGTAGSLNAYEDDKERYLRILSMAPDMYRTLKKNGWLVFFLGISWYEHVKGVFRKAGFTVDEIPIIWDRSDGRTFTSRPDRWFGRGYDIAIHAIKGEPRIVMKNKNNMLRIPPVESSDRDLLVERPVELYRELIQRLTYPGETVADFFVGSGSCPAAAVSTKRKFFGVEENPERRAVALKKIKAHGG